LDVPGAREVEAPGGVLIVSAGPCDGLGDGVDGATDSPGLVPWTIGMDCIDGVVEGVFEGVVVGVVAEVVEGVIEVVVEGVVEGRGVLVGVVVTLDPVGTVPTGGCVLTGVAAQSVGPRLVAVPSWPISAVHAASLQQTSWVSQKPQV
jgi:hypothetical protein